MVKIKIKTRVDPRRQPVGHYREEIGKLCKITNTQIEHDVHSSVLAPTLIKLREAIGNFLDNER